MPSPSSRSWTRSREARLWQTLTPARAGLVLRGAFGRRAGAEALLRAYLAETDGEAPAARFWIAVFLGLGGSPDRGDAAAERPPGGAERR
jgi:hypothetical protein